MNSTNTQRISATDMGNAVAIDPQFRMPLYPLLSQNITQIPFENGIIFDGCDNKQIIKGKATKSFLKELLTNLDGQNSLQEIANALSHYPERSVFNALSLLYTRGLLQEAHKEDFTTPLVKYFERHIDQTRYNKTVTEAFNRLRNTELIVHSTDQNNELLLEELTKYPVQYRIHTDEDRIAPAQVERLGVGLCNNIEDLSNFLDFDKKMRDQDIPWILIINDAPRLYFGPYFSKIDTFCFQCFLEQIDTQESNQAEHEDNHLASARMSMAVIEIINFISRISFSPITKGIREIDMRSFDSNFHYIYKMPYCHYCDSVPNKKPILNDVVEYENLIGFPSHHLLNPKDHQNHYKPGNLAISKTSKEYFSAPLLSLPEAGDLPNLDYDNKNMKKGIEHIAKLLLYTAGFKKDDFENQTGKAKRWAPTGGNLGSVNIYFVNQGIEDLEQGTYFYQASDHKLAVLSHRQKFSDFTQIISNPNDKIFGYFIFTGNFQKVSQKYRDFAYRITNLDAGVALSQFAVVANALNLRVKLHDFIDTKIEQWIDIDSPDEIVNSVVSIEEEGI